VPRPAKTPHDADPEPLVLATELTAAQRQIVRLLGFKPSDYGY
jgi:hypothetical protein